jgi:hypothetical protein
MVVRTEAEATRNAVVEMQRDGDTILRAARWVPRKDRRISRPAERYHTAHSDMADR